MGTIDKVTISLPSEMLAEIRAAIDAGEFANTSEAVREALRHWQRSRKVMALNDADLRRLVAEGRASGTPLDGETVLNGLRAKYAAMKVD